MRARHENLRPARVFPPGAHLLDELQARGLKQADLVDMLGRPKQFVSELINGKRQLTVETSLQLQAALGISARMWMNLENHYRLWLAEKEMTGELEAIKRRSDRVHKAAEHRIASAG